MDPQYLCKALTINEHYVSYLFLPVHPINCKQNLYTDFGLLYRENAGLLALTRVGSRRVVQISAGFMIFFSILGNLLIYEILF